MPISLQKASILKRISAQLLDIILAAMLAALCALAVAPMLRYEKHLNQYNAYYHEYEQTYDIDLSLTEEDINALPEEEQAKYEAASEALSKDARIPKIKSTILYLTIAIVSISLFLACLTIYFIVPLFFKHGQTLGKKVFGIAVMRTSSVKASNPVLFVRSILGLYTMEIMVPLFLVTLGSVGLIALGLLVILEIVVMCVTQTNSSIHDLLSDTVVVDMASQRIFESEEELIEYKKALQAEEAAKSDY